jgi:hypothetical protein
MELHVDENYYHTLGVVKQHVRFINEYISCKSFF